MNSKDINYLKEHGLEDDRVRLSVITDQNQSSVLEHIAYNEPGLMTYSPSFVHTPDLLKFYFSQAVDLLNKNVAIPFLIYDKLSDEYAGSTRFGNISAKDQRAEIGWTWIGAKYQQTGLNRHNKYLMLTYAFEKANCARIEFKADARNQQSRKAMEAIGATYEGLLRSHTLMSDNFRRDTVYYSLLSSEWPEIKRSRFNSILKN